MSPRLGSLGALGLGSLGDDSVTVIEDAMISPTPLIRSSQNVANGRVRGGGGSTPYYQFAAMPRAFPFMWHGWPGGTPSSRVAGETRELSGSGDLYESGLSPYAMAYPPLAHRGFTPRGQALDGLWTDLSSNERKLVTLGAVAVGGVLLWRHFRKGKRKNPAGVRRPRRGRKRRSPKAARPRRRRRWR